MSFTYTNTNHNALSYTGAGTGLFNVPRTALVAGTPLHIVVNNGAGLLSSVAQILPVQGGTGLDTSAATGVPHVTAGTWSVSQIVNADVAAGAAIARSKLAAGTANGVVVNDGLGAMITATQISPAQGGTGVDTSAATGVPHVTGGTWTVSQIVNADVAAGAAIARSKLAAGTPNGIVVNDGLGAMTSAAQITAQQGGTGTDSSAATGIAHVAAGTWSYSQIVNADVAAGAAIARSKLAAGTANGVVVNDGLGAMTSVTQISPQQGGTGVDTSAATGIPHVAAGTWSVSQVVNADVAAAAAIARTKLASGSANHVVVNNGSGVMSSVAQISPAQGGTGQDFSGVGVGPFVITNSSGTFASNVVYTTANIANTIVLRDGSGGVTLGSLTTSSITSVGNLTITAPVAVFGSTVINQSVAAGSSSDVYAAHVMTTNSTPTTLFTFPTSSGVNGTAYAVNVLLTLGNTTAGTTTGGFTFSFKGKNLLGVVTVSSAANIFKVTDGGLGPTNVSTAVSGTNILVRVSGIAATTIHWTARIEVVSQQF